MKNEVLLKKLYGIKDARDIFGNLDALIAEIKQEIARDGLSFRSVDIQKAAARFAKECWKEYRDMRPHIAGAFMYDKYGDGTEMCQGIVDGFVGVSYSKPFDGLMEIDLDKCKPIDFGKIIPQREAEIEMPDYAEMKQKLKLEKIAKNDLKCIVRIGNGQYFNGNYLVKAMELAGMTDGNGTLDGKGGYAPICFRNEIDGNEIECIVLPLREGKESRLLLDYYKPESEIV